MLNRSPQIFRGQFCSMFLYVSQLWKPYQTGGAQEETEPAEWDEDANCVRDAGWIPSGKECPWRFNAVMLFTTSVEAA